VDDPIQNSRDTLPLAADKRIGRVCLEFEKAWKSGAQPRIEEFLGTPSGAERARLFRELLLLEVDYRCQAGEQLTPDDYHPRFPHDGELIREVFRRSFDPADAPALGTKVRYFGDYQLLEEIARGGMGIVYKARQLSLNRVVALQLVLSGQFASEEEVERFRREAEAAANLDHPNIVAIHEVGQHEGQQYFSMAYVEGRSLAEIIRKSPLSPVQAARYVETVARAVEYAHQQGTLHRDLKPANILIDRDVQPRIPDFGLARRVEADSELTNSGQILGSPSYMPPEQASAEHGTVGPSSDVYALGAVLYDRVIGRPPFQAETPPDTLPRVLGSEPASPRSLNPSVPRDLETICLKCLEKEPKNRYLTARELAEELRRLLNGEPIQARPITALGRTWRWRKRNPVVSSLAAALVVALVGGLAGVTWQWYRAEVHADSEALACQDAVSARVVAENAPKEPEEEAERRRRLLYVSDMNVAQQAWEAAKVARVLELLNRHRPEPGQEDLRGFEWYYLW
jgi:serine/threonine protein kinase